MPDPILLPARLICHALADALQGKATRLLAFDRRTAASTRAGRREMAHRASQQAHAVATFGAALPHGACVDATLAGLLVALAVGHALALADIEDRLLELEQDARVERLDALAANDLPAVVRVVMGERPCP